MSLFSNLYGGGAGAPIGTIVSGYVNDADWLPLDNGIYLKANYPDLDTSKMLTFDGQSVVTGPTITAKSYYVNHVTGTTWYAYSSTDNVCMRSTDNGATWTSGTLPQNPASSWRVSYANGLFFCYHCGSSYTQTYYTSTDGLTWTTRSLPSWGSANSVGGVGYIEGRYVIAPSYAATSNLSGLYSTDGITWVVGQTTHTGSATMYTSLTSGWWTLPTSKNTGIGYTLLSSGGTGTNGGPTFWTSDGVNWVSRYAKPAADTTSYYTYPGVTAAEDAFGNLSDGGSVFTGQGSVLPWAGYKSVAGTPLAKTNLHGAGTALSEDHGITRHRSDAPGAAFSGSRLLAISATGVVTWLDVSPTKFRAARIPLASGSDMRNTNLYIKAR